MHQASRIAAKLKNDDKWTHFYMYVFGLLLTYLSLLVSNERSTWSGLTLADELLVCLIKISRASTNQQIGYLFEIHA